MDRQLSRRLGSKQQRANSQPDRQRYVCGSAKSKQETLAGAARIDRRPKLAESSRLPLTASPPSSWLPFRRPASGLHLQASPASSALPLARCSFALTAPPSLLFSPLSNLSSLPLVPFLPKHANNHARTPTQKERTADPPVPKNSWSIIIGLVIIVAFSGVSWFASPKGENQTVWRSTLILSAWSCYLMWAITFLAQWHPLINPRRSDLRPELEGSAVRF